MAREAPPQDHQPEIFVEADVTRAEGVRQIVERVTKGFGGVDILVNNVGGSSVPAGGFAVLSDGERHRALDLNLFGAVRLDRALIPGDARASLWRGHFPLARLPKNISTGRSTRTFAACSLPFKRRCPLMPPGSSIILNASTAASKGTSAFSVYSATKASVRSFARNWTLDLKVRNIRVNAVSPGVVPTPGYDLMGLTKEQVQGCVDFMVTTIPLGRAGTPDEIAKAVVFLASDDSSFVNGIELFVDGSMAQI